VQRRDQNVPDVILTNTPSTVTSCKVIPDISDHEIVLISTSVAIPHYNNHVRNIYLWHKANIDAIKNHITEFTNTFLHVYNHNDSIDSLWNEYKALCKPVRQ